jgi:hypothetical protein
MTKQNPEPPPLPGKTMAQVTAFARGNSLSVVLVAGLSLAYAAAQGQWALAGWAALALLAGLLEWFGQRRLRARDFGGLTAMVASQVALLAVIWVYAWFRWRHFDADAYWDQFPKFAQEMLTRRMVAQGLDPVYDRPLLMMLTNIMVCAMLALVALFYQGGVAGWYLTKARALRSGEPGPE